MINDIETLMNRLTGAFMPNKAEGINGVIHFHVVGKDGGDWTVEIKNKNCQVSTGIPKAPTAVLTANEKDCLDIITGKMNGTQAFLSGKLKIKGDVGQVSRLIKLFDGDKLR